MMGNCKKLEAEIKRLRTNIEIFAASDHYETLSLDESDDLMDSIMKTVVNYFGLE